MEIEKQESERVRENIKKGRRVEKRGTKREKENKYRSFEVKMSREERIKEIEHTIKKETQNMPKRK